MNVSPPSSGRKRARSRSRSRSLQRNFRSIGTQTVPRSIPYGLPPTLVMGCKYSDLVTWDLAAIALGTYTFSANGLYDVDISGTGHQPLGFDQLMAMYNRYTVIVSDITCKFNSDDTQTSTSYWFCLRKITSNETPTSFAEAVETPSSNWGGYNVASGPLILKQKFNRRLDHPGVTYSDDFEFGTGAQNPTNATFYQIVGQGSGSSNPGIVQMYCEIKYKVIFHDPKVLSLS